ncbi:uncharacterized protein LOC132193820 [Neocloeon triangulifer]|uniref:uncharacterized protein LOC132193820 n=1 Tax=Neocloeon triangulifer TaxID=2078957 RepID=UPI00286F9EC1|nr:uncharacterized protein LOC132193820 [Neocloeon triangulifer]
MRKWILLLAICCSFSAFARSKKITLNECWNYGKNASIPPGRSPVFRFGDTENLSFEDCGRLSNPRDSNKFPPWRVYLRIEGKSYVYNADLISDQTLIIPSTESTQLLYEFEEGKNIQILAGDCTNKNDQEKCFAGRGLISQKLLDFKVVQFNYGMSIFQIHVWRTEKLKLAPSLRPVCLWNRDKSIDAEQTFYLDSYYDVNGMTKASVLPEATCYTDSGRNISEWECNLYGNAICTQPSSSTMLYVERNNRFYVRASVPFTYGTRTQLWHDILPFTNQIVLASQDLAVFPQIPEPKPKIDFGSGQSFAGCGPKSKQQPWLARLSRKDHSCEATLISSKVLVTAANCLFNSNGDKIEAVDLIIELGPNKENHSVSSVVVHPGYNHSTGGVKDDVALVILKEEVALAPICLWNSDYDLKEIAGRTGSVGKSEGLKVVSYAECYESNRHFFSRNLRPLENFCAAFPQNRSGACEGENRGGFVVENQDRFFLRGVATGQNCDPKLFTDLTYFVKWIVENTPDIVV